jgi:signal transduction histidine kinase
MFRRRLALVLGFIAVLVVMAASLAVASLALTERQVLRGRVASDIATGFIQLSAQKQRLRAWVAQMQQDANADVGVRSELLAAMQGTLQRLKVLSQQAIELDGSAEAREEHLRRRETLSVLEQSVAALAQSVERAQPLAAGADAREAWVAQSRVFDQSQGHDVRRLIAENIARETAAVQRERAAADATLAAVRWLWLGAALALAGTALAALMYFAKALRAPLRLLSEGARALQEGRLEHRIALDGRDEFSEVARSVNALAVELERHRERESRQRLHLEDEVAARTRELADALASLRRADARRRRLFADVSHELRTPTTVIRGEAEITLRGVDKPPAEYREALRRIVDTSRQLGAVIDDLLSMARHDIETLSLQRQPVDLLALAEDVQAQLRPLAERQGVSLVLEAAPGMQAAVTGDPLRLRQLLGVLLDNAIRYSHQGGVVRVGLESFAPTGAGAARRVQVRVRDQGIGIPEHELPHLFERRFRGDAARRHSPEGSGLGLGIAQALATAHGGELTLQSEAQGTEAVLWLPEAGPGEAAMEDA